MHTDREPQTHEHKRHLVHVVAERAGPSNARVGLQPGARRIGDPVDERVDEYIAAWETRFGQMRDNDAAHTVGVDEAGVEDKGDEVVVQDDGLEIEVCGNEKPGGGEGEKSEEGDAGALATGAAGFHDVMGAVGVNV